MIRKSDELNNITLRYFFNEFEVLVVEEKNFWKRIDRFYLKFIIEVKELNNGF